MMASSKDTRTWEFGDFQTPDELARRAVTCLARRYPAFRPRTIIEPTCGIGSFLLAAADAYPAAERVLGLDIESGYLERLGSKVAMRADAARFELLEADFFKVDWDSLLAGFPEPFLVVGNPPWVTNADVGRLNGANLPAKSNFHDRAGMDALTGKANFDISEWMMMRCLKWVSMRRGCVAMLCKTSVARKTLRQAWADGLPATGCRMVRIDAMRDFSAAVDACFFSLKIDGRAPSRECEFYSDFEEIRPSKVIGFHEGMMLSHVRNFHRHGSFLGGDGCYTWRSGLKHDCSKVMELSKTQDGLLNGYGRRVDIEDLCVFPLMKSSDLANGRTSDTRLKAIVTQRKVGQSTEYIHSFARRTWNYLQEHADALDARKSSIYRNKPRFSVFGVGDYAFADWKVAISAFYKRLDFQVVGPVDGKPVVFDDTVYFLGAATQSEATFLAELLNSAPCKRFLESMICWSDKRPITIDLMRRLNLEALSRSLGRGAEYDRFAGRRNGVEAGLERQASLPFPAQP